MFKWHKENQEKILGVFLSFILILAIIICIIIILNLIKNKVVFLKFLEIILAWPVIGGSLIAMFLITFKDSVDIFLRNSKLTKAGPLDFTPQNNKNTIESSSPSPSSTHTDNLAFGILDSVLVQNTKLALKRIRDFGPLYDLQIKSGIFLFGPIEEQNKEKDAIIYALLRNNLIKTTDILTFEITETGREYLNYLGI